MELMEPLPPRKTQCFMGSNLLLCQFICKYPTLFLLRINLNNLEKSNPVVWSKQFLFQTCYAKKLPPQKLSLKTNMSGPTQTEIFLLLEDPLGTGTAIHLNDCGFILSSHKIQLPWADPWICTPTTCPSPWNLSYCSTRMQDVYILLPSPCFQCPTAH